MTRVDRVMDMLEYLRAREVTTVGEIAVSLGVSSRTVLRDLATLRDRGWPIRAESGPGGGVRLDRDRGVATVHMAIDEMVALWVAAQLSASVTTLPWSAAARSALNKIFASLPHERARLLRQFVRRIVVGRPASPRVREGLGTPSPELLTAFERAFEESLCISFDYTDRFSKESRRCVEPHGLLVEAPAWYLLARDTANREPRMFRMDRIRRARVLLERPFDPDFEGLRREWIARRDSAG